MFFFIQKKTNGEFLSFLSERFIIMTKWKRYCRGTQKGCLANKVLCDALKVPDFQL